MLPALGLALAACGSSSPPSSSSSTPAAGGGASTSAGSTANTAAALQARSLLPAAIKSSGVLTIVTEFEYAPYAMEDASGTRMGIDYDIGNRLAQILGLKAEWIRSIGFSTLIPAVQDGKAAAGMEAIGIKPSRLQVVSFVQYITNHDTILVTKGNPHHINPNDLCGTTLADEAGDFEGAVDRRISAQCVAHGKPAIEISVFPTLPDAVLAITAGRVEGDMEGVPSCAYTAMHDPALGCADGVVPNDLAYAGIAVAKNETQLGEALTAALKIAHQDGSYMAILEKWGVPAITAPPAFLQ